MKYVNKQKMFILSALSKRGPFHAAKVVIIILLCNSFGAFKFFNVQMLVIGNNRPECKKVEAPL